MLIATAVCHTAKAGITNAVISDSTAVNVALNDAVVNCDMAKSPTALSNCSNEGDDLLAAWYDGSDIRYKYITSNPMVFRMPRQARSPATVFSNPMNAELEIHNAREHTGYAILNANGKIVMSGKLDEANSISTAGLGRGEYTLRILGSNYVPQILRFSKI